MQIEDFAWMVRDLGERPSSLHLTTKHLFVGGWDGRLTCWNIEGNQEWTTLLPDRIQEIVSDNNNVYATSGLFIVAVAMNDGELLWQVEAEGSADSLILDSENEAIFATSSVYDIEHGDFMESACWQIDANTGEVKNCVKFGEKPWHLSLQGESARLGLGRPRGGVLLIGENVSWHELGDESPVTCGSDDLATQLYGHASGSVSKWNQNRSDIIATRGGTIENVSATPDGILLSLEGGVVELLDNDANPIWEHQLKNPIVNAMIGFEVTNSSTVWILYRTTTGGGLLVCDVATGQKLATFELESHPTALLCFDKYTVVSTTQGSIFLIESNIFQRRITGAPESSDKAPNDQRSQMMAKLRKLREN